MQKKELERRYLESFREVLDDFPAGVLEGDRESTDFIIVGEKLTVGIELMRLYRPAHPERGPLQMQESLMYKVVNEARVIYEKRNPILVDAHVLFDRPHLRKSDVGRYAKIIAGLVEREVPNRLGPPG